jgi:hypothetical protein
MDMEKGDFYIRKGKDQMKWRNVYLRKSWNEWKKMMEGDGKWHYERSGLM